MWSKCGDVSLNRSRSHAHLDGKEDGTHDGGFEETSTQVSRRRHPYPQLRSYSQDEYVQDGRVRYLLSVTESSRPLNDSAHM